MSMKWRKSNWFFSFLVVFAEKRKNTPNNPVNSYIDSRHVPASSEASMLHLFMNFNNFLNHLGNFFRPVSNVVLLPC